MLFQYNHFQGIFPCSFIYKKILYFFYSAYFFLVCMLHSTTHFLKKSRKEEVREICASRRQRESKVFLELMADFKEEIKDIPIEHRPGSSQFQLC